MNELLKKQLLIYGDIKIGSDYDAADINLLITKLHETTFFFKYIC